MTFKVRASGARAIMTNPKSGSGLSETCKDYIREQWIIDKYGREKREYATSAIQKGLLNEEQGISILCRHWGDYLEKNERRQEDDYMKGTADIITDDRIADIKCSHNIFTFAKAEITPQYEWQLQVYMHLWFKPYASLVYVLTDTPDNILHAETKSILWKLQDDSMYQDVFNALKRDGTYSDIPEKERIKEFKLEYKPEMIDALKLRVIECQEFYNNLAL